MLRANQTHVMPDKNISSRSGCVAGGGGGRGGTCSGGGGEVAVTAASSVRQGEAESF